MPTTGQITLRSTAAEFIQKSHVGAVDLTYDLTPRWSLGGKYAHRRGEMSLSRDNPDFFDNPADLFVVRTDFALQVSDWDRRSSRRACSRCRIYPTSAAARSSSSRVYLNPHFKVGDWLSNFTRLLRRLADLSFDHRGAFYEPHRRDVSAVVAAECVEQFVRERRIYAPSKLSPR